MPPRPPPDKAAEVPAQDALTALFTESIRGADAYAAVMRAARRDGEALRVGNRFLRSDKLKEVAFVAAGNAAAPMASALVRSLGDTVTQGLVIGPEAPPEGFPFRSRLVREPFLPSPEGMEAATEALELASGLGPGDLFIPLLSPGALGMLALPPEELGLDAYRSLVQEAAERALPWESLGAMVRGLSRTQGGRLAAAVRGAPIEALVVERGEGGAEVGAGPASPPPADTGAKCRQALESLGRWSTLPSRVREGVAVPPVIDMTLGHAPHTVVVGGPADALDAAGVESATRRHRPKLVALHDPSGPEGAARHLLDALEVEIRKPSDRNSRGVAVFSGLSLGSVEGRETSALLRDFLVAGQKHVTRREVSLGVIYTGGSIRPGIAQATGTAGAHQGPDLAKMKGGFTDVGMLGVAWYSLE